MPEAGRSWMPVSALASIRRLAVSLSPYGEDSPRGNPMTSASLIYEMLGGRRLLGAGAPSLETLRERVRQGLPFASLTATAERLHLGREEISSVLLVPDRTLSRRKQERQLRPDESDRLFRFARVAAQALSVLGDWEKTAHWLRQPNRALAQQPPLHLLDTDAGTQRVEEVLGRIQHGVFS
jgi:putative toxin-antitoxin system antitoxin component (TIGR02293 family)